MIDRSFLYAMRRDLKSQAEGLAIQRAAVLSQIAEIEKILGIKGDKNERPSIATGAVIAGAEFNKEGGD